MPQSDDYMESLCSDCNGCGEGRYEGTRCSTCHGKGVVYDREDGDDCDPPEPEFCDEEGNILP